MNHANKWAFSHSTHATNTYGYQCQHAQHLGKLAYTYSSCSPGLYVGEPLSTTYWTDGLQRSCRRQTSSTLIPLALCNPIKLNIHACTHAKVMLKIHVLRSLNTSNPSGDTPAFRGVGLEIVKKYGFKSAVQGYLPVVVKNLCCVQP